MKGYVTKTPIMVAIQRLILLGNHQEHSTEHLAEIYLTWSKRELRSQLSSIICWRLLWVRDSDINKELSLLSFLREDLFWGRQRFLQTNAFMNFIYQSSKPLERLWLVFWAPEKAESRIKRKSSAHS